MQQYGRPQPAPLPEHTPGLPIIAARQDQSAIEYQQCVTVVTSEGRFSSVSPHIKWQPYVRRAGLPPRPAAGGWGVRLASRAPSDRLMET